MDCAGLQISSYEIVQRLGRGTSCDSYLARDPGGKSAVAKRLSDKLSSATEAFLSISELSAGIRMKKHLAIVVAQKKSPEGVFLLREFVEGEPLLTILNEGRLMDLDRPRVTLDLCDAVRALSSRKVIHGGIHPGNVIISPDGRARLTDFGVGRCQLGGAVDSDYPIDGLRYLAPEQFQGQAADVRSDIYSLGLLAVLLHTGQHPRDADDYRGLKEQSRQRLDPGCEILAAAIAIEPRRRYPDVDKFREGLVKRNAQNTANAAPPPRADDTSAADPRPAPTQQRGAEADLGPKTSEPPQRPPERPTDAGRPSAGTKQSPSGHRDSATSAPPAKPAVRTRDARKPGTLGAVVNLLTSANLLERNPPAPVPIRRNGQVVQQPLAFSNSGEQRLDLALEIHGRAATISPSELHIAPGTNGSAIITLAPETDGFANVVLQWSEADRKRQIVLKLVPQS